MHTRDAARPAGAHVLVSAASRHGATAEIADVIAATLEAGGHQVDLVRPQDVDSLDGYDAVVMGSAVYTGHWLAPARAAVRRLSAQLVQRPVWLFSSGPVGDPPVPAGIPADVDELVARSAAREHRVLAGRVERTRLSVTERAILRVVRAPEGDFRDWRTVEEWAREIALALSSPAPPLPRHGDVPHRRRAGPQVAQQVSTRRDYEEEQTWVPQR